MKSSWSEKIGEAVLDYVLSLPVTLTENSRSRLVRLLGLAAYALWFIPALFIALPLMLIALCFIPIEAAWEGIHEEK